MILKEWLWWIEVKSSRSSRSLWSSRSSRSLRSSKEFKKFKEFKECKEFKEFKKLRSSRSSRSSRTSKSSRRGHYAGCIYLCFHLHPPQHRRQRSSTSISKLIIFVANTSPHIFPHPDKDGTLSARLCFYHVWQLSMFCQRTSQATCGKSWHRMESEPHLDLPLLFDQT